MLKILYVKRNAHEISLRKTLQTFYFHSTRKLKDLLGLLKEVTQLPISGSVLQNMFE